MFIFYAFRHCLFSNYKHGDELGTREENGFLASLIISALHFCRAHYNVYLQSIAVNGQLVPVDPSVFATSGNRGTIVDSGTTLAYIATEAYDPFVNAVSSYILPIYLLPPSQLECPIALFVYTKIISTSPKYKN